MKNELVAVLKEVLSSLGVSGTVVEVEIPENEKNGEYTTNVAMRLGGKVKGKRKKENGKRESLGMIREKQEKGKSNTETGSEEKQKGPMEIALQVKGILDQWKNEVSHDDHDHSTSQSDQIGAENLTRNPAKSVLQDIERIEVAPPGFINFYLSEAKFGSELNRLLNDGEGGGTTRMANGEWRMANGKQNKRVMVEFTDPNPFKEFHIGHLYSNAVGESLSRLYEAIGWEVKRADYFGDVGMHVAKALWGMKTKLSADSQQLSAIGKLALNERVKWMGAAYAAGSQAFEADKEAAEEMKRLNKLIFIGVQELLAAKTGIKSTADYRQGESPDEGELSDIKILFETGRQWSLDYFESLYKRLGTKFDYYYPESEVGEYGTRLVLDNLGKVFEKSDGAIVYKGDETKGLHTRVFINALGLPTYEAKELGLNWKKHQDYPAEVSVIVTGKEINEYFNVLLAAMGEVIPQVAKKTKHLGHGMVRLPEGKMSSRTGKIVTGESLIDAVKERIYDYLSQSNAKYTKEEQTTISEKAAIASIKYSMLKVGLPSDITFDLEKSISFDGDSGPYLQYAYARAKSVLRKAEELSAISYQLSATQKKAASGQLQAESLNTEEHALIRLLVQFPEIVTQSASNFAPSTLCSYLFHLAQAFNLFYAKHTILGGDKEHETGDKNEATHVSSSMSHVSSFRLSLTAATAQVLKNGLYLLGIETLERM